MTQLTETPPRAPLWSRLDWAWVISAVIVACVAVLAPADVPGVLSKAFGAFISTLPFIIFAVCAVAWLKATDAEHLIAKAFTGSQLRMIVFAALAGGLSPFCSCEVIPFIAAMLALGVPLSAVMAFWLASPLMDPAMFSITAAALGIDFAVAKTVAAVALGLFGGLGVMLLSNGPVFADPLREKPTVGGCCGVKAPFDGDPVWRFWEHAPRRQIFQREAWTNGRFLVKWLVLAYLLEAVMIRYVPAEWIAQFLGGEGVQPVLLGALLGGPAYLNGYAAVPLVSGLLEQGMNPGAAMAFVLAGGVSCIPAATAVFALVKMRVFLAYLGFAFVGSLAAGMVWGVIA